MKIQNCSITLQLPRVVVFNYTSLGTRERSTIYLLESLCKVGKPWLWIASRINVLLAKMHMTSVPLL